jgi:hypothetical protein
MVGHFGRVISLSQGLYLNTGQHKHRINTYTYQTSMPCVGTHDPGFRNQVTMDINIVTREGFAWLIITGSGLDDFITGISLKLRTINYNSSQLMTASDSLHSLLDYESLLFHCDWLTWFWGSESRIGHYKSLRTYDKCRPMAHSQMNWTNSFITSGQTEYKSSCLTVPLSFCFYPLPRKRVLASRCLATDYSGFQACHNTKLIIYWTNGLLTD